MHSDFVAMSSVQPDLSELEQFTKDALSDLETESCPGLVSTTASSADPLDVAPDTLESEASDCSSLLSVPKRYKTIEETT